MSPSARFVLSRGGGWSWGWGERGLFAFREEGFTLWQWRVPAAGWCIDEAFCHSKKKKKKNLCKLPQMGGKANIQIGGCFANTLKINVLLLLPHTVAR